MLRPYMLTGTILFVLFLLLAAGVAQREYEFVLESDFQVSDVRQWALFYQTLDLGVFTKRFPYTLLDGQPIVTGLFSALIEAIASYVPTLATALPTGLARDQMATTIVNVLSYSGAGVLFYATMYQITKSVPWSAVVALAFFLAPEMLQINMIRPDYQISLTLATIIYISTIITLRQERGVHAVWLGIALAFASTIKISGLVFGVIPAIAYLVRGFPLDGTKLREWTRFILLLLGVFSACYLILMTRYLYTYSIADWVRLYPDGWKAFTGWITILLLTPRTYYNYELLLPHGIEFIVLYIVSAVAILLYGLWRREPPALLFSIALLLFALIGLTMQKHVRGGYHMLPFMYGCIGLFVFYLLKGKAFRTARVAVATIAVLALLSSSVRAAKFYTDKSRSVGLTVQSVVDLWRPYRTWIKENLPYGSVCLERYSEWRVPHIHDVSAAAYRYGPFDYPYLSLPEMARYLPPTLEQAGAACNVIVTNDWHRQLYSERFQEASPETAAKWRRFYQQLEETYPPFVLKSAARQAVLKSYDLAGRELRIYALSKVKASPCDANRAAVILSPTSRQRHAHLAHVPAPSKQTDMNGTTPYLLCEDTRPLGPSQSIHDDIRREGNGRWSHWGEWVYFSTSDNTLPATNGRSYYMVLP